MHSAFTIRSSSQSTVAGPSSTKDAIYLNDSSVVFEAPNITLTFNNETGSITSIQNPLTGQVTDVASSYPLWSINTGATGQNGSYTARDADHFSYLVDSQNRLVMNWGIPQPAFAVTVIVEGDSSDGGIGLRINVTNYNQNLTIFSVNFPYISSFDTLGSQPYDNLAIPHRDGLVVTDFQAALRDKPFKMNYPGTMSMQFFLIYDNNLGGLFAAAEDSASNYKALEIANHTYAESGYNIFWELYSPVIKPGNQFQMNYSITLAGFAGQSWADGAAIYRNWATHQWYTERGPLVTRTDIPQWFKNIGYLWLSGPGSAVPNNQMSNFTQSLNEVYSNRSVLLDWWAWYQNGGNGIGPFPDYPPSGGSQAFGSEINAAHIQGGRVMLFFSGRLTSINTTAFQQNKQYMIADPGGNLHLETFKGAGVNWTYAVADPTSSWWQSEIVNYTSTAIANYHADGVYLDSVGLVSPILDYANQSNPKFSGSQWWQAWAQIFTDVRGNMSAINPEAIATTEGVSEVYLPFVDGFWVNLNQDVQALSGIPNAVEIPLFAYVYQQYTLVLGTPLSYQSPGAFAYSTTKAATFGMLENINVPPYLPISSDYSSYLNTLFSLQENYSNYVRFGEELPPPNLQSGYTQISVYYVGPSGLELTGLNEKAVQVGLFEATNGTFLMSILNPTNQSQVVKTQFYKGEFGNRQLESISLWSPAQPATTLSTNSSNLFSVSQNISAFGSIVERIAPTFQHQSSSSTTKATSSSGSGNTQQSNGFEWWGALVLLLEAALVVVPVALFYKTKNQYRKQR